MDPVNNFRAIAEEIIAHGRQLGLDLEPVRKDFSFQKDSRWIDLWRKDSLPGTGPTNEPFGTLHYSMQGPLSKPPKKFSGGHQGEWSEAGVLESMEDAFALVKAWLLDWKEVDDLPPRSPRRTGFG
jgi:hypothetical protein